MRFGLLCLAPSLLFPQTPLIQQGSFAVGQASRLEVVTVGNLTVRGELGIAAISYTLRTSAPGYFLRLSRSGEQIILSTTSTVGSVKPAAVDLTLTVPAGLRQLSLESRSGDISASDLSGETQVRTAAGRIEIDRLAASLEVRSGGGEIRIGRVNGSVRCFSSGGGIRSETVGPESWIQTAGGDIFVGSATGALHLSTAGGSIQVTNGAGPVFASTNQGAITIGKVSALVTAETAGGAIHIQSALGALCRSNAGDIRIRAVGGGPLRANTSVGNIVAYFLSGARIMDSFLSTGSGDITVSLPSNSVVTVQATNQKGGQGWLVSEFAQIRLVSPILARGSLGEGGATLRLAASGGSVSVHRQK